MIILQLARALPLADLPVQSFFSVQHSLKVNLDDKVRTL